MPQLLRSTAVFALLTTSPAIADVTPDDVWAMWQAQARAIGLEMWSKQHADGDTLVIDEIALTFEIPNEDAALFINTNGVRLTANGDGTVLATYPEVLNLSIGAMEDGETDIQIVFEGEATAYQGIFSGTPDAVTSKWRADALSLVLQNTYFTGTPTEDYTATIALTGPLEFESQTILSDTKVEIVTASNYPNIELSVASNEENAGNATFQMDMTMAASVNTSHLVLPREGVDVFNLPAQFRDGLSLASTSEMGEYKATQLISLNGDILTNQSSMVESQNLAVSLNKDGLAYETTMNSFEVEMAIPGLPTPANYTMKSMLLKLVMPILRNEGGQNAEITIALEELALNDEIWALFDPEAKLARDLSSFKLDISATLDVLADFVDFEAMEKFIGKETPPVLATEVSINELFLSGAGAELFADGAFTLNNDDLETYDGFPAPEGSLTARIEGAHGLIDTLIDMGLVGSNEALGARAALNLLTVADGEDVLRSEIEVKANGEIIANGQRIK